jgi:nicotinamide riboside kinase
MKDISNSLKILATPAEPYDSTSKCPYELGECPNAQIYWNDHKRDFQLEISNDTFYVYEDDRLVGLSSDTTEWHSPIGKIIEHEND